VSYSQSRRDFSVIVRVSQNCHEGALPMIEIYITLFAISNGLFDFLALPTGAGKVALSGSFNPAQRPDHLPAGKKI
jgi:hypothetical protein